MIPKIILERAGDIFLCNIKKLYRLVKFCSQRKNSKTKIVRRYF